MAETYSSIHDIPAEQWDMCVGPQDVLLIHRHLAALEDSGVASPESGFTPSHVVLRDSEGKIAAAAPTYLRSNSRSELGVDLGLQMAHERLAGPYYPKLQVELPMMPQAGMRLLVRKGVDLRRAARELVGVLQQIVMDRGASSVQISFMRPGSEHAELLRDMGMSSTQSNTFVWVRGSETTFDEYLERMTSHHRAKIRRERRMAWDLGLTYHYFRGPDLVAEMAQQFFNFYKSTYERYSTVPALNLAYFQLVFATMPELVDLSVSFDGSDWAGAMYSLKGSSSGHCIAWGQGGDYRHLHFEQVIYGSIERALATGVERLDFAGLGSHKSVRGLRAEPVHHAFWFRDPAMREVIEAICQRRTKDAETERESELALLPFVAGRD
ncbi:GNAT family N-acetyltransferase [Solirhodobacter olei]|uniref:GNAT family N-acetyltransferase n=1 Tax=Solirhodobacter olei TaxID=2493082 RepID=UPI0013E34B4A|nr:GNAT family N-acetyltransferase [Solirhodobacter olei]